MHPKRVFKTKTFDRWAEKLVSDTLLCVAARQIEAGAYEADLGHGLVKKRIARPGQGKRGATRTFVAKQHPNAIIFLVGREKSSPGADFSDAVLESAKLLADALQRQSLEKLNDMAVDGKLKEICDAPQDQ